MTTSEFRTFLAKSKSLYFWANEAAETVYAQTCHDPELQPSWLPELVAVLREFHSHCQEVEEKLKP